MSDSEIHHQRKSGVAASHLGIRITHSVAFQRCPGSDGVGREQQRLGRWSCSGTMATTNCNRRRASVVARLSILLLRQTRNQRSISRFLASTAASATVFRKVGLAPRIEPPAMTTSSKPTVNWMAARRNASDLINANHQPDHRQGRTTPAKPMLRGDSDAASTSAR